MCRAGFRYGREVLIMCSPIKKSIGKLVSGVIVAGFFMLPFTGAYAQDRAGLEDLSPFELKEALIAEASEGGRDILNAGRGNPNFLATMPRHAFFQLGVFALREAERSTALFPQGVTGFPQRKGLEDRFRAFAKENRNVPGVSFLVEAVSYVHVQLGMNADDFLYEMCEGILGAFYPVPGRMLTHSERIVAEYLRLEMIGKQPFAGDFDIFAVEGGTAAMTYIFNTMRENFLIRPGDSIALGSPIFSPYLEIPHLDDYRLNIVNMHADPARGWQYSKQELDKLRNPKVKAFFLVNPSNPPSVKMDRESLEYIGEILKARPDLIILTDDVYGTFADDFVSLFALYPKNTILVYSYSKYFGSTGWRLGVIATHRENVLDGKLAKLSKKQLAQLHERYKSLVTEPENLKFIDRLVADSRAVALNHTAGLSTPQQVQMVLFSLHSLMDTSDTYKNALKQLIRSRKEALYREIGIPSEQADENRVDYYTVLGMEYLVELGYDRELTDWLLKNTDPMEILFRLAREERVVLLPGRGFGTLNPTWRVSLANLDESDYVQIGRAIHKVMAGYIERYNRETGKNPKP